MCLRLEYWRDIRQVLIPEGFSKFSSPHLTLFKNTAGNSMNNLLYWLQLKKWRCHLSETNAEGKPLDVKSKCTTEQRPRSHYGRPVVFGFFLIILSLLYNIITYMSKFVIPRRGFRLWLCEMPWDWSSFHTTFRRCSTNSFTVDPAF